MDAIKKLSESIDGLTHRLESGHGLKERSEIVNSPTLLRLYIEHGHPLPGDRSATIPGEVLPALEDLQQRLGALREDLQTWQGERQRRRLAEVGGHISRDDDGETTEVREEN